MAHGRAVSHVTIDSPCHVARGGLVVGAKRLLIKITSPWARHVTRVTLSRSTLRVHVLVVPSGFYKITSLRLDVPLRNTSMDTAWGAVPVRSGTQNQSTTLNRYCSHRTPGACEDRVHARHTCRHDGRLLGRPHAHTSHAHFTSSPRAARPLKHTGGRIVPNGEMARTSALTATRHGHATPCH